MYRGRAYPCGCAPAGSELAEQTKQISVLLMDDVPRVQGAIAAPDVSAGLWGIPVGQVASLLPVGQTETKARSKGEANTQGTECPLVRGCVESRASERANPSVQPQSVQRGTQSSHVPNQSCSLSQPHPAQTRPALWRVCVFRGFSQPKDNRSVMFVRCIELHGLVPVGGNPHCGPTIQIGFPPWESHPRARERRAGEC